MNFLLSDKRRIRLQNVGIAYNFIKVFLQIWIGFYLFIKSLHIDHKCLMTQNQSLI
jgi:hypothetical protein